jgi:hypothetical protein
MSTRVAATRCGASKKTIVRGSSASASNARRRSPGLRGRNPSKQNRSVASPDSASAVSTADGPGTAVTGTPASTAARTTRRPGSDTLGMPASVTTRTVEPSPTAATRSADRACSLCSW